MTLIAVRFASPIFSSALVAGPFKRIQTLARGFLVFRQRSHFLANNAQLYCRRGALNDHCQAESCL